MGNAQGNEAGGTNKLMIMLPLMMLSGRIDWEDDQILFAARCVYGCVVTGIVVTSFLVKGRVQAANDTRKIYIEPPKVPFGPQEPAARTESTYLAHELAQTQQLINNALMGAAIMSFIHVKMGVNQVLLLQSVMLPLTHLESPLIKKHLLGTAEEGARVWKELLEGEEGVPVVQCEEDVAITEAWNAAKDVNFAPLLAALDGNINHQTTPDGWTALMVACGVPVDVTVVLKKLMRLGAQPELQDAEGWTALHWAAYHDRPAAARQLLELCVDEDALKAVRDNEGKTALEVATTESNAAVVEVLGGSSAASGDSAPADDEGLRHRNTAETTTTSADDID